MTLDDSDGKPPSESSKVITSELVDQYRTYVKKGDFCIDVEAHTGDTSLPIGLAAGQEGFVLAFEPNPHVYHVLEKMPGRMLTWLTLSR